MKNTFKKVLLGLGISLMLLGCGVVKRQQERNDYPLGTSMKISCNIENARQYQVDSLMVADTLPPVNKWLRSVYLILGQEEPYKKVTKRITQN